MNLFGNRRWSRLRPWSRKWQRGDPKGVVAILGPLFRLLTKRPAQKLIYKVCQPWLEQQMLSKLTPFDRVDQRAYRDGCRRDLDLVGVADAEEPLSFE